jgi:invasion associated locus B (IalB) protein
MVCARFTVFAVLFLALSASGAWAQKAQFVGSFQDWESYAGSEGKSKVCYAVTQPSKKEGQVAKRGEVYLFVTQRPGDNQRDVVNVKAGYAYKPSSTVNAAIGNQNFGMYVKDDTAWNRTAEDDKSMVRAMIKGASVTVRGTPASGGGTTDTYSLKGFTAAYQAINKACGIK